LRLSHRGQHQLAEKLGVMILEHRGIDRDCAHGSATVGGHLHHAASGGGLDGPVGQLGLQLLQPALHLLSELKKLLEICHAIG
jgi:hypothetical protein